MPRPCAACRGTFSSAADPGQPLLPEPWSRQQQLPPARYAWDRLGRIHSKGFGPHRQLVRRGSPGPGLASRRGPDLPARLPPLTAMAPRPCSCGPCNWRISGRRPEAVEAGLRHGACRRMLGTPAPILCWLSAVNRPGLSAGGRSKRTTRPSAWTPASPCLGCIRALWPPQRRPLRRAAGAGRARRSCSTARTRPACCSLAGASAARAWPSSAAAACSLWTKPHEPQSALERPRSPRAAAEPRFWTPLSPRSPAESAARGRALLALRVGGELPHALRAAEISSLASRPPGGRLAPSARRCSLWPPAACAGCSCRSGTWRSCWATAPGAPCHGRSRRRTRRPGPWPSRASTAP